MDRIVIGAGTSPVHLLARYANRHGLIAGATGTGKTISLVVLAEGFSRMGVPVFMADVKGDVSGIALPGAASDTVAGRAARIGLDGFAFEGSPVVFWDVYGTSGHPVRTTVSEVGPQLLARMLELNDTQAGVLQIAFTLADDRGLLLLDLEDLRALLTLVAEDRKEISARYGLVSAQSIAAIQRNLLTLEREGGTSLFGEPALELADLMRTELSGRGVINVLAADQLVLKPRLYSTFLLWLLSELFETLPEVGDLDKPKLVFIFDEAHLLFDDAPPALMRQVEQVVRLIRSKGVGIYFCSQLPDDVPAEILGQLGNRIQHALRAFTPRDQKAVRAAAETFASNPELDVAAAITQLGVGEALVSTLQEGGVPMPVQRTLMSPPRSRMGSATADERGTIRGRSPVGAKYDTPLNRESAAEMLTKRSSATDVGRDRESIQHDPGVPPPLPDVARDRDTAERDPGTGGALNDFLWGTKRRQGAVETMAKQAARTVGSQLGRQILRGLFGTLRRG